MGGGALGEHPAGTTSCLQGESACKRKTRSQSDAYYDSAAPYTPPLPAPSTHLLLTSCSPTAQAASVSLVTGGLPVWALGVAGDKRQAVRGWCSAVRGGRVLGGGDIRGGGGEEEEGGGGMVRSVEYW